MLALASWSTSTERISSRIGVYFLTATVVKVRSKRARVSRQSWPLGVEIRPTVSGDNADEKDECEGVRQQQRRGIELGLFTIVSPIEANRALGRSAKEVHELLAWALVLLAGLHAAAAFWHHLVLRDGTMRRMIPQR